MNKEELNDLYDSIALSFENRALRERVDILTDKGLNTGRKFGKYRVGTLTLKYADYELIGL